MRIIITTIFLFSSCFVFSQIKFPNGFKLIKGVNGAVIDDIYTNGRYAFDTHQVFVDFDFTENNDSSRKYVSEFFGFPFHLTKDSLCWGTGISQGFYKYVVIIWGGENIELYSNYNDSKFSYYSKWLITTIREYRKKGKDAYFPIRFEN